MTPAKMSRREFMTKSASGIAGLALGASVLASPARVLGANDRLSVGVIGTGGRGRSIMGEINGVSEALNVEITAVCDVWKPQLAGAVNQVKEWTAREPRAFANYEDILALDDVDAVAIATPDFHHARMLTQAARAGKDVFIEKPMATDLTEGKEAVRAVEETGRIVQVGTQRRSQGHFIAGAEFMRTNPLGKVSRVEASWNDCAPRWRRDYSNVREEDVDWKLYLGHLAYRPFDPRQFRQWHLFRDFTNGTIGLLGTHLIDVVHWFMDDPLPVSAVAHGGNFVWDDGREHEDTVYMLVEYPKGFILNYSTGLGNSAGGENCFFYGTRGSFDTASWKATGAGGGEDKIAEEITVEPVGDIGHVRNFLECVRQRRTPNADVYNGYAHSVAAIIGEQALLSGRKVLYNIETGAMEGS